MIFWLLRQIFYGRGCGSKQTIRSCVEIVFLYLQVQLKERGIWSCETIRQNRLRDASLEDDATLQRKGRGAFTKVTDQTNGVSIVIWFDNKTMLLSSTFASHGRSRTSAACSHVYAVLSTKEGNSAGNISTSLCLAIKPMEMSRRRRKIITRSEQDDIRLCQTSHWPKTCFVRSSVLDTSLMASMSAAAVTRPCSRASPCSKAIFWGGMWRLLLLVRRIVMLSGYYSLPHVQHYWSTQPDMGGSSCIQHNEQELLRGTEEIHPLFRQSEAHQRRQNDLLSVDEAMVPYFSRHSAKMFIQGKSICFSYKIWMLCGNDGYSYHISIICQGKDEHASKELLGTRVAHGLYSDNFFASYDLLVKLADNDMREIGTVYCAKWYNNSVVTAASNEQTHSPLQKFKRRIEGQRKDINQPDLIRSYNNGMGGVDLLDRYSGSVANPLQSQAKVSYASEISTKSDTVSLAA
ncbi:PiggyBac transposable element-derived protein [Trichinella pseudospiralis]